MPTLRLIVRYDGTNFAGWQRQLGVRTVQEELERAASAMARETVRVHGSGRTDAGVHAFAQVASFRTEANIPMKGWLFGLNSTLPGDMAVREVREVPEGYDPRRASGGKRYRYIVHNSTVRDPMLLNRVWLVHEPLDLARMREGAAKLVGTHDFNGFRASDCERKSTHRTLFRVEVIENYRNEPMLLAIEVEGTAFLKNMVRIITGTLVDIGRKRIEVERVEEVLAQGDRTRAGMTAPAGGLYLDEVFVRPEFLQPDDSLRLRPGLLFDMPSREPSTSAEEIVDDE